jgi:type VI secretion system protein ImpA
MPDIESLLKPIPGSQPTGVNLRYDPIYDKIKEARREEAGVPEWDVKPKVADWPLVVRLAGDALTGKSKDLQLAAWLTEALLRQEGIKGLRAGLSLLRGLLERFWDGLYPEPEDGDLEFRASPLQWVGDYLVAGVRTAPLNTAGHQSLQYAESRALGYEKDAGDDEARLDARKAALADGKLAPEEFDKAFDATPKAWYKDLAADVAGALDALQGLDATGGEKFGESAPSYIKLRSALEDVQRVAQGLLAKKLETDPDPVGEAPVTAGPAGAGGALAGGAQAIAAEPTSAEDAANRIAAAARYLQRADPRSPAAYLLLRGFRWGELRARGGALDPRLLAAPPTDLRTRLKGLLLDGKWADLLTASEAVMATPFGRGWLDLQRYVLTAFDNLGSEYEPAAGAVRVALAALLRDFPDLVDATLMDDTSTANAETRAWLQQQSLAELAPAVQGAVPAAVRPGAAGAALAFDSVYERAMQDVRGGRPDAGIELLMREAEREKTARGKFVRRAQAAAIMVDHGLEPVALPVLRELVTQIEAHHLEDWEAGDLVARPLGLLYRCLQATEGDSGEAQELYQKVCRLDPLQAMAFAGTRTAAAPEAAPDAAG